MGEETSKHENTLWILTEVYYPEEISTGFYLTSIAEGLAATRDVRVITGQPKHMSRGLRAPKHEIRNGVEILRSWGTTLSKNVLPFRLLNMLTIGISIFFRSLLSFKNGDQVLVATAPPSLPVTTALAALIRGASLIILVQDSYPEILVAVGAVRPDSFFVRFVHLINRSVYKYATRIVVMGRDMNALFQAKTAGLDIPVVTIPNWADLDSIHPTPRTTNVLLAEMGLTNKFVLTYAGNIGHPTDVETLVDAAEMLVSEKQIHFIFIGDGAKKPWLINAVAQRNLSNVTILDYRPRSEQIDFLNACDIGLVALIKGMRGTAMPSRTYNLMAAGKPVLALAEEGSELAMVIAEEGIGWRVDPGKAHELCDRIMQIYKQRSVLTEMGERSRRAAVAKYSAATAIEMYRQALS